MNKNKENLHSSSIENVFQKLSSDRNGLSPNEAKRRLVDFGPNDISKGKGVNSAMIFIKQFANILIYILFVAAGIAWFYGKIIDVYVILGVILLNAAVGFIQEYRAERAIEALKKIIVSTAKVIRGGELLKIKARELVPGDVVLLEEGDKIPADGRIFEAKNFRTVEASLTGESTPGPKIINDLPEDTVLADRKNMVWMGTFAVGGKAKIVVSATGEATAFGKIAKDIAGIERSKSHFEKKIDRVAKQIGIISIVGTLIIFLIGFTFKGMEFQEIVIFAIASLVSGIPEGLPATLVIVLTIGAGRMAKKKAIIRRLPATETLGVTTVISTDKTGTLTQNTMNIREIFLGEGKEIKVTGEGWEPVGRFCRDDCNLSPLEEPVLGKLMHIAAICNNAKLFKEEGKYRVIGDPTEAALVVLAEKAGLKEDIYKEKRIDDMPFESELKYRASLADIGNGKKEIYMAGAPEVILKRSRYYLGENGVEKMSEEKRNELLEKTEKLTDKAMRTIALAYKEVSSDKFLFSDDMAYEVIFVGTVGMIDPPRPEARDSVLKAQKAGIRVIMTTGDHKGTALAISRDVGIVGDENDVEVLTGSDLSVMSQRKLYKAVRRVNIFARVTPEMKLKIASALQDQGQIVAMTGDGVNDAPALKKADIGIAMGVIGTDVAREASEIILADDNFASIVNAIEEGRIVFINTRQASAFLITIAFANYAILITSLLIFTQLPLMPTQILWLNLVGVIPALALGAEPGHGEILNEPPQKKEEEILSKEIIPFLILMIVLMTVLTLSFFFYHLTIYADIEKARAVAFTTMVFTQLFNLINMRSVRKSIFEIGFFSNRSMIYALGASLVFHFVAIYLLDSIFHFKPLSASETILIIVFSSLVLWLGEMYKYLRYGRKG